MLGQELARVRVGAADPLADELVEVADHLAVGGEVLRAHRPDRLGHAGHELVEHLALEPLDELVEPLARVRLEEVVVLEAADPLADVGRQRVELVEPPRRDVAEHLAQVLGRAFGVGARRLVEATLDPGVLLLDDLLELAADVAEHVVELVALEHRLALAFEPVEQVLEPGHVAAGRVARPPAAFHEPAQRLGQVALGHHVVGERVEDLVRLEVGQLLAAVPGRVAGRPGERVGGRSARGPGRPTGRARPRAGLRPQIPRIRGVGGHRW